MGSRVEKKSSSFPLGESQLNSEQEEIDKSLFFFFKKFLLLFFFFFLAVLWSMWDPSSLTRDQTHTVCIGSAES